MQPRQRQTQKCASPTQFHEPISYRATILQVQHAPLATEVCEEVFRRARTWRRERPSGAEGKQHRLHTMGGLRWGRRWGVVEVRWVWGVVLHKLYGRTNATLHQVFRFEGEWEQHHVEFFLFSRAKFSVWEGWSEGRQRRGREEDERQRGLKAWLSSL